jgi:hypothetical protein
LARKTGSARIAGWAKGLIERGEAAGVRAEDVEAKQKA